MELKDIKRKEKKIKITLTTPKSSSEWMKKNNISPTSLFNEALREIMEKHKHGKPTNKPRTKVRS